MIYGLENYDMTNSLEVESSLSQLDFNLIKENLRDQIHNLDSNVNYVSPIENKFRIIMSEYELDADIKKSAIDVMLSFHLFIINEISESFDLDIDTENKNHLDISDIANSLYEFLVIKARRNITKFFSSFIIKNKKSLVEDYQSDTKKDLSSTILKKAIKNKDDIILLSKSPSIIRGLVFNMDFDDNDVLKMIVDTEFHGLNVRRMKTSDVFHGNFMNKYSSIIRDNSDLYDDVYHRVYIKLSDKLTKK